MSTPADKIPFGDPSEPLPPQLTEEEKRLLAAQRNGEPPVEADDALAFLDVDVHDFAAADEPGAEALVAAADGSTLISPDGLVLVWGSEGAGKTTVVLDWLVHCAAGCAWHGILHPARPVNCLIVENEPTTQRVPSVAAPPVGRLRRATRLEVGSGCWSSRGAT